MKYIAAVLLALVAQSASAVLVIGDSISSKQGGWPEILREYGHHVAVDALSLRTAMGYTVPGDLYPRDHKTVIYYLGTNDMFFGSVNAFKEKFSTHMATLLNKEFKVMVLIPADYSREDLSAEIRGQLLFTCALYEQFNQPVTCLDLDPIWDESQTINNDGIHPDENLSRTIADYVNANL